MLSIGAVAWRQFDGRDIVVIRLGDIDAELRLGRGTDCAVLEPNPVLSRGIVALEELQLLSPDEVLIGDVETLVVLRLERAAIAPVLPPAGRVPLLVDLARAGRQNCPIIVADTGVGATQAFAGARNF